MDAVSFTKDWIESDQAEQDIAKECVETHHRDKYNVLKDVSDSTRNSTCRNPRIRAIFSDQTRLEREELYSKGAALGSSDDAVQWSAGRFEQPAPIGLEPQPLLNIFSFTSGKMMTEERILASDGTPIDVVGIFSWFSPRYSLLTDRCRALQNYRISPDFSSCVKCGPGTGPTEDLRECKPCTELVGQRYSQDGVSCVRCPPGQWPSPASPRECLPCHQLEGVRYSEDRSSCERCEAGTTPSPDSTQCLDCSLPGHVLNPDTRRCLKCPEGNWPSTEGYDCSPCNLLEGVRYSDDRRTCVHCPPLTTPTEDSTECLDCSGEFHFYTSSNKTRCAECPGGQGATEDHLGCHRIDGQWGRWGPWTSCSKSCIGEDGEAGLKYRERQCSPPKYGGEECDRAGFKEDQQCAGESTSLTYCPIDGYWGSWKQWGPCSKTCGGGTQFRNRFCNKPQHGGEDCQGEEEESRACNTGGCPVDGRWDDWSQWGPCSKACGGGDSEFSIIFFNINLRSV